MWHKVVWLVFWVNVVLWFGNFWGCAAPGMEQNYKVGEPERRSPTREDYGRSVLARDEADGSVPVAFLADDAAAAPAEKPADGTKPAEPPKPADAAKPVDPAKPAAAQPPAMSDTAPSVKGLDRSHWPKVRIGPKTGVTVHSPLYYHDCPFDRSERAINAKDPIETQLNAALAGAESSGWDSFHLQQLPAQVGRAAFDTVALPVRVILTPPWRDEMTP